VAACRNVWMCSRQTPCALFGPGSIHSLCNVNLLSANISIANTYLLQLKADKGPVNVPIFRRNGWSVLGEWGPNPPIGMPINGYDTIETPELRRADKPLYLVCKHRVLTSPRHTLSPYFVTVSSHPT